MMFVTCILQMCGGRVIVQKYSVRNLKSLVKSDYLFHVMKYLFPQIGDLPIDNPAQNAEGYFRSAKVTGLIEKQFHAGQSAVLLYAGGVPGMAYLLENGQGKSMALAEFSAIPQESLRNVRAIKFPDIAGRLALLSFESALKLNSTITDDAVWREQVNQWKRDQWTGLVEIKSETLHGLVLLWQGELQESDIIFSTPLGLVTAFPHLDTLRDFPWNLLAYSLPASDQAYQYAVLRHGSMHWMNRILSRYQELVGHKLLQTMDRELNQQAQPWSWKILFNESQVLDSHFFIYLNEAEQAYRALFMSMGSQMNIVIGNILTQRLLNETFEQIHPDERAILQSLRLVPAAFSE